MVCFAGSLCNLGHMLPPILSGVATRGSFLPLLLCGLFLDVQLLGHCGIGEGWLSLACHLVGLLYILGPAKALLGGKPSHFLPMPPSRPDECVVG